ncbi:PAS domain-containing sensor histidine kinase [Halosimplex salinum]|uniref:PAS domain-containing sensor histidine kinase n=1 Tax=Halosimplex salinum TaxID=1710538 RepID=UPI000F496145|nr:PAS domain-containing sensor histidine kinase [Halosimplex salinum]
MTDSSGERERRESAGDDLVAAAFDALPAQVAVLDGEGVIRETNHAWETFGRDNDLQGEVDMVGENYLSVCDHSEDDSAADAASGIRSVLAGERAEFALEYPCHSPDERRWFLMRALALPECDDPHGLVMHVDITDRKEAELRVEANNETLSTVASVLSHDLRNPLNVAMGGAQFLADDPDADAETVAERSASILSSLERMNAIVDDALVLARDSERVDTERVDMGTVARDAWSHVETGGATLEVVDDATLVADASVLTQLFENLFRNSVEHGSTSSRPQADDTVEHGSTSPPSHAPEDSAEHGEATPTVTVGTLADGFYVADDGPGIAAADRERVFDVGYSTNKSEGNTGMGLAIVRKVADAHGWTVDVTDANDGVSGDRSGARFEFRGVALD